MTVHDIHDALTLLPADLITAADKVRSAPKTKVIQWRRWVSLAAVLALVLGTSLVFARELMPRMGDAKKESAVAQEPAAAAPMAPAPVEDEAAAEEAMSEAPAEDASADEKADENGFGSDHNHRFAEEEETAGSTGAYCGNMMTTIYLDGAEYSFAGRDSVAITDILIHLDYDPNETCRCMTEFTVDTEKIPGIEVNLTEGFARCELGQAALTEKQAETIREIIGRLQ